MLFPPLIFCLFRKLLYFIGISGVQLLSVYTKTVLPMAWCWSASVMDQALQSGDIMYFLFSVPWSLGCYPSEVCQRWSACCITASKSGWATAWSRTLNTYVPGPSLLFHVHLAPSQLIDTVPINVPWDTLWESTEASELVHATALCWEGSGWQTRNTSPLRWPALPCQRHTAEKSSWKPAVLPKRTEELLVGSMTALFIYFTYLPHSSH